MKQPMPQRISHPQPVFQRAFALHGQGRLKEAEELYKKVLESDGRHYDSIFYLGCIRLQQNRFSEAELLFRRAVKINKKSADAYRNCAIALTGLGRPDEALTCYRKALDLNPHDAVTHVNSGHVLQRLGRHEEAVRHCRMALSIAPHYPEAHNNLGDALQSLDRTEEAIEHYRQALALRPNDAVAHNNLGSALAARNRHQEAIEHCKKALALAPNSAQVHMNLANSLGGIARPQAALEHYQKAISIDPLNAEAHTRTASMLLELGREEEAITHCKKALNVNPHHIGALQNLGNALCALGRVAEAMDSFQMAVTAAPRKAAGVYYDLVGVKQISASDPHLAAMQQLASEIDSLTVENQIGLHFALGKAYADTGDHQRSFQHLLKGNALKRKEFVEYDDAKFLKRFERVRAAFARQLFDHKQTVGDPSSVPVFIVGMPRSGTSLVEQILASHPDVFGAGERSEFGDLVEDLVRSDGLKFPEAIASLPDEQLRALGTNYVRAVQALAPHSKRITDKMPSNFFYPGLIHLALPNARIIDTRRDPRDIALSCFSILFASGHPYTYDLAELGRHVRSYEKLMEHWRQVLPIGAMIEVQYEEFVRNFESEAKRIVEYCGLEWHDNCLSFDKTERVIRTASVMQVRQPIYDSSIGRWRFYEKELEPFLRAYSET